MPNGRFLDTQVAPFGQSYEPFGVEIQSYVSGLLAEGEASGYVSPPGADPEAELVKWYGLINAGEPYVVEAEALAHQIYDYHQGYGIPLSGRPAPMLLESGWTDDLFPVEQSLRVYNQIHRHGRISLMFGDLGHSPGTNKVNTDEAFNTGGRRLLHRGAETRRRAAGQRQRDGIHRDVSLERPGWRPQHRLQLVRASPRDGQLRRRGDPARDLRGRQPDDRRRAGPDRKQRSLQTVPNETEPDTATYTLPSTGFTLMGQPTVTASIKTTGTFGELASRLWDVLPSGEQRLISRGIYRLSEGQQGTITFQLHGSGYEFAAGDTVKLELLGRDAPYYRASNGTFAIEVSNLKVTLPTL